MPSPEKQKRKWVQLETKAGVMILDLSMVDQITFVRDGASVDNLDSVKGCSVVYSGVMRPIEMGSDVAEWFIDTWKEWVFGLDDTGLEKMPEQTPGRIEVIGAGKIETLKL